MCTVIDVDPLRIPLKNQPHPLIPSPVNTGLFEMIFGVLTTCHTEYTWDRSICIFLFNRTTLQVFVTYLIGALYVYPLWFCKRQHDNRVRSKLFVACQRWWFHWRFWFVPSVLGYLGEEEEHKSDLLNKKIHILLSRGSVRSTRGLGPTMTARGQSIGISIGMLLQTRIMFITVQKTSKYYTTEFDLEEGF